MYYELHGTSASSAAISPSNSGSATAYSVFKVINAISERDEKRVGTVSRGDGVTARPSDPDRPAYDFGVSAKLFDRTIKQ